METLKSLIAANKKKMELLEKALKDNNVIHSYQDNKSYLGFEYNKTCFAVGILPNGTINIDIDSFAESSNCSSKVELYVHYQTIEYKNKVLTFKKDHTVNDIYPEKLVIDFT